MTQTAKVLVASSDLENGRSLSKLLVECGLDSAVVSSLEEARALLAKETISLVICDAQLTGGSFRELLPSSETAKIPVVVASRLPDTRQYLEAMRLGAFDFIASPYRRAEMQHIVSSAMRQAVAAGRAALTSYQQRGIPAAT
ncbi:MAG: response regulator [Candidatus Acidiferrales bacterium]